MNQTDIKKYLLPDVVARLSNMELRAKLMVEGFMAGLHKSPYHGFSVEFAEHRQYMPGDDIKFLDWKVFARTDRFYIKQFEEETNLKSYILLDISKSMDFSSSNTNISNSENLVNKLRRKVSSNPVNYIKKLEYGSYLAASLAYMMLLQRDAISLTTYDETNRSFIPPRATNVNLNSILRELSSVVSKGKTGTATSLNEIASKIKRRGLVIVISDLFDEPSEVIKSLRHFRFKGNEVIVFQILDPVEMNFLEGNPVTLVDIETNEELFSQPYAIQKAYKDTIKEFIDNYKRELRNNGIDYEVLSTEMSFDKALIKYLGKRTRLN